MKTRMAALNIKSSQRKNCFQNFDDCCPSHKQLFRPRPLQVDSTFSFTSTQVSMLNRKFGLIIKESNSNSLILVSTLLQDPVHKDYASRWDITREKI